MLAKRLAFGAAASVLALAAASAVYAQETTGAIRGQITDESGSPVANATVVIRHEPTGGEVATVTNAGGFYSARGLRVGGPYTITASAANYEEERAQISSIAVGDPFDADLILFSASAVREVVVTASFLPNDLGGAGPSSNFNERQIQSLPSISRDIKDVARIDPFAVIQDPDNQDALSFGGVNTRFNQLTVDGIRQNDDFGLNNNGYPTQRSPISLDAVEGVNISAAPFSVINNGFIGGAINAVTKSGGNTFSGSAFYEFTSDDYRGDNYETWDSRSGSPTRGQKANIPVNAPFEETTWGASLGGPILRDRLFFFVSYEKFESQFALDDGPAGSGKSTEIPRITDALIQDFRTQTQTIYSYDPGSWVNGAPPVQDEKWLAKIDWNITDDHRLAVTWQETIGNSFNGSVSSSFAAGNSVTQPRIGLESLQYDKNERLTQTTAQLYSNWTPNFSTELRVGFKETETTQIPLGGLDVGQVTVTLTGNPLLLAGAGTPQIRFGADPFRHDNYLYVETQNIELIGRYSIGAHDLMGGVRTESIDVNNVFVSSSLGEWSFSSWANYLSGTPASLFLRGAVDPSGGTVPASIGTARDGAAEFSYRLNSVYAEDQWQISDTVRLLYGARYDWFAMDDKPIENPNFITRHGYSNAQNLDGKSVFLPRASLNWEITDQLELNLGIGRFSSQGLNVWLSNPFANDGMRQVNAVCGALGVGVDLRVAPASCTFTPGNGDTNSLDPNFKIPTAWKYNASLGYDFDLDRWGNDWRAQVDLLFTEYENSLLWRDLRSIQIGTAPDGRPVYGRSAIGVIGANRFDMMLTNSEDGGHSRAYAFTLSKDWSEGLWDGLSMRASYARTDAEDRNPMTSSIADSSYVRFGSYDHQNPPLATSDYEIRDRFSVNVNWARRLFGDNETSVNVFAQKRSGMPFSYTFHSSRTGSFDNDFGNVVTQSYSGLQATSNQLFYVPQTDGSGNVTLTSDPIVTYVGGFDIAAFDRYLKNTGLIEYAGSIAPRNGFRGEDVTTVDVRLSQELPAFFPGGAKLKVYMDIENFGNLLNPEWGVLNQYTFHRSVPVAQLACAPGPLCDNATQFTYSNLQTAFGTTDEAVRPFGVNNASLWQVKFGIRYEF